LILPVETDNREIANRSDIRERVEQLHERRALRVHGFRAETNQLRVPETTAHVDHAVVEVHEALRDRRLAEEFHLGTSNGSKIA
jgi:hypothetical protein